MKKKTNILLLLLIAILCGNCNTYKPIIELEGKTVRGKIIDGKSGEVFIGQSIYEFDRNSNNTITDTSGNFKLVFLGNNPIIKLTGFYEPIYIKVNPNNFNNIIINSKSVKSSKKVHNKISRFIKRRKSKFSNHRLRGTWEVIRISQFINSQWAYLDEIEPGSTKEKLEQQFPINLKKNDLLKFDNAGNLFVNSQHKYRFNKGKNYLSISHSDIIYMFDYKSENKNLFSFRKDTHLGEIEWILKRK